MKNLARKMTAAILTVVMLLSMLPVAVSEEHIAAVRECIERRQATHHSIVEWNGRWYLFYHDCELSNGINHRRNVKFTELTIHEDGTIDTIRPYEEP